MEWITHAGKNHTTGLVIDYIVELVGMRGRIAGAGFELHHSISGQAGRGGGGEIAEIIIERKFWYRRPIGDKSSQGVPHALQSG